MRSQISPARDARHRIAAREVRDSWRATIHWRKRPMHVPFRSAARFAVRHAPSAIALVTVSAFAACSDSTAVGRGGSQLGFTTSSSVRAGAASASLDAAPITKNGHTIVLKEVTIVVERAQLK